MLRIFQGKGLHAITIFFVFLIGSSNTTVKVFGHAARLRQSCHSLFLSACVATLMHGQWSG